MQVCRRYPLQKLPRISEKSFDDCEDDDVVVSHMPTESDEFGRTSRLGVFRGSSDTELFKPQGTIPTRQKHRQHSPERRKYTGVRKRDHSLRELKRSSVNRTRTVAAVSATGFADDEVSSRPQGRNKRAVKSSRSISEPGPNPYQRIRTSKRDLESTGNLLRDDHHDSELGRGSTSEPDVRRKSLNFDSINLSASHSSISTTKWPDRKNSRSIEQTQRPPPKFEIPEVRVQPPTTDTESESTGTETKDLTQTTRSISNHNDTSRTTSERGPYESATNEVPKLDTTALIGDKCNIPLDNEVSSVKVERNILAKSLSSEKSGEISHNADVDNDNVDKAESKMDKTTKDISTEAIKQIEEIESDDDDDILNRSRQEEDFEIESSEFVFDPDGNISYYWMGLVTLTVMYNCWMIILRIAFPEMREDLVNQRMFNFFDLVCDLFYLADVFVQLRTAYLENGILVLDPVKLSRNYRRKPEFIQDMIAIAPVGTLATFVARFTDTAIMDIGDIDGSDVYIPIVRIPRLLKVSTVGRFFDISDSRTSNPNIIRAMKLSMYLTLVIHWIACFYYMVSLYEGLGSNDWVYPNKTEDLVFRRKYVLCIYWAMMTLTTIGETAGPTTDLEYIFTGVTFLIGVFVFAAVVGNVGDVISNMNAARQEFQSRMDQIKFYMNHRRVPEVLQNRVKRWADYSWSRTQAMDEISMLEMLPERIRTEIAIHVHLETLKKVKIFEECEIGLLHELVLKLRAQIYSPGDYICRTGEIGREMYIINHGKVEILVNNSTAPGGKMVVASLSEGNYFGEISLLKLDSGQNKRTADVRSVGYSELLVLSRRDLMSALVEYPDAKQILEAQARERMEKNREVRRTSTVESSDSQGATVPSANTEPPSSNKKKDQLMQLIKSNDFQRLVKGGKVDVGKEMSELRHVIRELRSFDSQSTKYRIQQLAEKCDGLQEKLRKRDVELRHAIRRVNELELILASPEERVKLQSRKKCNGISLRHRKHKEPNSSDSFLPADTNGASHSRKMRRQQRSESTESSNSHNSPRDKIHSLSHVVVPGISINGVVEQEVSNLIIEKDDDDDDLEIDDELDNREENEKVVPNILADLERLANDVNLYSDTSKYSDDFSSTENSSDDDDTDDR